MTPHTSGLPERRKHCLDDVRHSLVCDAENGNGPWNREIEEITRAESLITHLQGEVERLTEGLYQANCTNKTLFERTTAQEEQIATLKNEVEQAEETRIRNSDTICRLADSLNEDDKEIATLTEQVKQQRDRGDGHAESLKGIRDLLAEGEVERALLWCKDALSGYTESTASAVLRLSNRVNILTERLERARADALEEAAFHCEQGAVLARQQQKDDLSAALLQAAGIIRSLNTGSDDSPEKVEEVRGE